MDKGYGKVHSGKSKTGRGGMRYKNSYNDMPDYAKSWKDGIKLPKQPKY